MLNALSSDQDLFVAELSLAQARRDELLSLVQLYNYDVGGNGGARNAPRRSFFTVLFLVGRFTGAAGNHS